IRVYRHRHFSSSVSTYLKYDVVHLHNFNVLPHYLVLILIAVRRTLGMLTPRIIITTHGGFNPYWNDFSIAQSVIKKLYNKTAGLFLLNHTADKIIAVSRWEYDALTSSGVRPEKIELIPNGVENEAYSLPSISDEKLNAIKPYLCYIGRIARIKNLEFLIRAVKDLDLNLVIAGQVTEPEYYEYIMNLINELDANKRIFYYGEVYGRSKYALIDNALAILLMSKYESEGIIVKEAMARGKGAIVSNIETLKLLVKNHENGFVVAETSDLKRCTAQLLTDTILSEKIATNNRRLSLQWKWSHLAERVLNVYESA
ncbi:MAG: glycosyltransferase family 4 protein, partial [Nitrososphaera sp.]